MANSRKKGQKTKTPENAASACGETIVKTTTTGTPPKENGDLRTAIVDVLLKRIQVKSATSRFGDIQLGDNSGQLGDNSGQIGDKPISQLGDNVENGDKYIYDALI